MLIAMTLALRKCLKRLSASALKLLGAVGLLAAIFAGIQTATTTHAAPQAQAGPDVRIERIKLIDDFEDNIKSRFDPGARIRAELELKDLRDSATIDSDDPDYQARYTVSFSVNSLRAGTVYQGRDDPDNLRSTTLTPGERGTINLIWNVPYDFPAGEYNFRTEIGLSDTPEAVEHFLQRQFRIDSNSDYVLVSDKRIDFGNVSDEQTPRSDLIVIAPINRDAGDLVWRVSKWPTKWLEIVHPPLDPDDDTRSIEVANNGYIVLQVSKTALFGNFADEDVVISTNAGEYIVKVSAKINRHASGTIDSFDINPPRQVDTGDKVSIRYRIDNEGRTDVQYRVTFTVVSPSNAIIYDSSTTGEDQIIEVADGDTSGNLEFLWQVPFGANDGNYRVGIELRDAHDFGSAPFDAIDATHSDAAVFKVLEGAIIRVNRTEFQFSSVLEQNSQRREATFRVTNIGRLSLEWEVEFVPNWIELVSPLAPVTGDGEVTVRIKTDIQPGSYSDDMVIISNGGRANVTMAANIRSGPRPTSTPTSNQLRRLRCPRRPLLQRNRQLRTRPCLLIRPNPQLHHSSNLLLSQRNRRLRHRNQPLRPSPRQRTRLRLCRLPLRPNQLTRQQPSRPQRLSPPLPIRQRLCRLPPHPHWSRHPQTHRLRKPLKATHLRHLRPQFSPALATHLPVGRAADPHNPSPQ